MRRRIMKHGIRVWLIGALAGCFLLVAGCASLRSSSYEDDSDVVTVRIVNHHRLNVTIFNVAQGHRDRLAEATAAANLEFQIHLRRFPGNDVQLYGDAVGSPETVRAEMLHLQPGDTVEWTLETELARSSIVVR